MGGTTGTCTVSGLGEISGTASPAGAGPEIFAALYIQRWEVQHIGQGQGTDYRTTTNKYFSENTL